MSRIFPILRQSHPPITLSLNHQGFGSGYSLLHNALGNLFILLEHTKMLPKARGAQAKTRKRELNSGSNVMSEAETSSSSMDVVTFSYSSGKKAQNEKGIIMQQHATSTAC